MYKAKLFCWTTSFGDEPRKRGYVVKADDDENIAYALRKYKKKVEWL